MNGVLDSIRVVELTEALAGPYCAMLLGDFGAEVVKGGAAKDRRPVAGLGSAVSGQRVGVLPGGESQQAID